MTDSIAETLDIKSELTVYDNLDQVVDVTIPSKDVNNDVDTARETMYKMMAVGEKTLLSALNMMNEVPTARGVETITGLIKAISEISQDLVSLHPPAAKVGEAGEDAAFVGTVSDFLAEGRDD